MNDVELQQRRKECPVCLEVMRIRTHEQVDRIPGVSQTVTHMVREWVCPDCSYEEEVEDSDPE